MVLRPGALSEVLTINDNEPKTKHLSETDKVNKVTTPRTTATARQISFAQLVGTGASQAAAYRAIFNPKANNRRSCEQGSKMAALPLVAAEIERIRSKSEARKLLTMNDRLRRLSEIVLRPGAKDADVIRAVDVYSRISGDQAPDRHEVSGPDGAPIATEVHVDGPLIRRLDPATRLAELRAARQARIGPPKEASPAVPPAEAPIV